MVNPGRNSETTLVFVEKVVNIEANRYINDICAVCSTGLESMILSRSSMGLSVSRSVMSSSKSFLCVMGS